MKTADTLQLALLFLRRRKARTFLTVLGVIIGTVCIVLMLSIGISNYARLQETIAGRSSLTEIRVTSEEGLSVDDVAQISAVRHATAVSPVLEFPGRLRCGPYEAYVTLQGLEPGVLSLQFAQGGLFPAGPSPELVVGGDATRDFVNPESPPDYSDWEVWEAYEPDINWLEDEFTLLFGFGAETEEEETDWLEDPGVRASVCGVTGRSDSLDSTGVYLDLDAARQIVLENAEQAEAMGISLNRYPEVLIRVDGMDSVEEVLEEVRFLGFEASSDVEFLNEMRAENSRQLLQLLMIGLISLAVSAIGIANTMYAGILERRRDIGIMKVLGMRRSRIKALFVAEAALIGLLGGLIGLALSWVATAVLNASMASGTMLGMYFTEGDSIVIPWWIALGAVLIAALTGILAGLWPAAKASRMSPLEAMRHSA